ncbi:unnamed protein product [Ectocarpus sp. CCAP 1310/34]|nr:unnamed protein product [Ectocarpus sp. CCAP 1310/34]
MEAHNSSEGSLSETSEVVHSRILSLRKGGNDHGAVVAAEESLNRSVDSHGPSSAETRKVAADLVLAYNHLAMKRLSENNIKEILQPPGGSAKSNRIPLPPNIHKSMIQASGRLLQKASLLTSRGQPFLGKARLQARALTLNNLGCLMKKWGKPRESVKFLARALRIEAKVPGGADNPAGTHVNMSAALSTIGLHREAATHAGHAIELASQAMMEQKAAFSYVTGPNTASGDLAGMEEDGAAASVDLTADDSGRKGGVGCSDTSVPSVGVTGRLESSSVPRPEVHGEDGETVCSSAVADDGRTCSPEASSSVHDADHDVPEGGTTANPAENGTGGQGGGGGGGGESTGAEKSVQGDASSVDRQDRHQSAAGGLLAIACFNLGVEREHLGQLDAAIASYKDARSAADQHLGPESPVAKGIEIALEKASAAASAAASYSRKRAASRSRVAVASFPCIGKLKFGHKNSQVPSRFGGVGLSPRCRSQQQHGEEIVGEATARDLLELAYTSPRPCPAPPHKDSWARLGRVPTPRLAPPGRSASRGPQRAGRWTSVDTPAARAMKEAQRRSEGWRNGGRQRDDVDGNLRWRALACAEWQCSPREALHAQRQVAEQHGVDVGMAAPTSDAT